MLKKLRDVLIGQVTMIAMFIIAGLMYEGIGYSDLDDIMPYIQIALIQLVVCMPIATTLIIGINTIIAEIRFDLDKKRKERKVSTEK